MKWRIFPTKAKIQFICSTGRGTLWKDLWYKFNCFGLRNARLVNDFLLWVMFLSIFFTYAIMYIILPANDADAQWYWYFVSVSFQKALMSLIVVAYFKGTRNDGIATAWLVVCGVDFAAQILGLHEQIFWFSTFMKIFLCGLAYYAIKDIRDRKRTRMRT